MTERETIVVLDFGSQYSQLIARRVREAEVYCELIPYNTPAAQVTRLDPAGYILSGGPASVYAPGAPRVPEYVLDSNRPILGICYGMQLLAYHLGGQVDPAAEREYGLAQVEVIDEDNPLFSNLRPPNSDLQTLKVWMSHGDRITRVPHGFKILARSDNSPVAAMGDPDRGLYGLQFHPEVVHTPQGRQLLRAFVYDVCSCQGGWTPRSFIEEATDEIRTKVGTGQVLCGLSGGVDSAVTAALLQRAVGDNLTCIFVNNGLLRSGEP
jgi:GMP synthase (glutamine-hydrolysing)